MKSVVQPCAATWHLGRIVGEGQRYVLLLSCSGLGTRRLVQRSVK